MKDYLFTFIVAALLSFLCVYSLVQISKESRLRALGQCAGLAEELGADSWVMGGYRACSIFVNGELYKVYL